MMMKWLHPTSSLFRQTPPPRPYPNRHHYPRTRSIAIGFHRPHWKSITRHVGEGRRYPLTKCTHSYTGTLTVLYKSITLWRPAAIAGRVRCQMFKSYCAGDATRLRRDIRPPLLFLLLLLLLLWYCVWHWYWSCTDTMWYVTMTAAAAVEVNWYQSTLVIVIWLAQNNNNYWYSDGHNRINRLFNHLQTIRLFTI